MDNLRELAALLRVKECDLRGDLLTQCQYAVDRGIHIGGAESAIAPMAALYHGGILRYDLADPATTEQDVFLLSKGHAVAALAAVYADVGYFPKERLKNSRGWDSLVKGHPGPVIPGVPVATGPLGHGISVACGYALRAKEAGAFDVYCMVGDGELQEGSCWEGILFAGERRLDNLCLLVDRNSGQSDDTQKLFLGMERIPQRLEAFGFRVLEVDCANMEGLLSRLWEFRQSPRDSRPTAIVCDSFKGFGGYASATGKHKGSFSDDEIETERALLQHTRDQRVGALNHLDRPAVIEAARQMNYRLETDGERITGVVPEAVSVGWKRAKPRDKALRYDATKLPQISKGEAWGATDVAVGFSKVFAADPRFYTIDADLSNVSGLYTGTGMTNRYHAINTGIAESNMMCMAEALAACGNHVWVSTFGPFFDWQAFRRIAVSYQERQETIESSEGWLSEGHNLDITFLSTASNLDTAVNGATHMSNDDICFFDQLAHVKIIDTCCPRQFLAVSRWIAEGNRGLVYLRVMRSPSPALCGPDYMFEYGKGTYLRRAEKARAVIVSSGHGVLEAIAAADLLEKGGVAASVVDMPSYDSALLRELAAGDGLLLFAEQNNGTLFDRFSRDLAQNKFPCDLAKVAQLSARDSENRLRFIQSGTYQQLAEALGLSAQDIATTIKNRL